jgi:DNA-directed RNA polymerase subunit RPC12/RpoP
MKILRIPSSATNAAKNFEEGIINFLIEHQCPQCGAPATLEETDRLLACQYCRVNSYLMTNDFFRYILPHPPAGNKNIIFFPYWRFKGMLFFCGPAGIVNRFVDISHQAIDSPFFPASVGIRSQALKLRFATSDMEGSFLRPRQSFDKILGTFKQRFGKSLPEPISHQANIGETLSLIYSPFYLTDRLHDAILDKPISMKLPEDFNIDDFEGTELHGHIHFVSTLCPNCGWDLDGARDSLVLACKNCNSTWYPVGKKLKQLKFAHYPGKGDSTIYLPFWRIKADLSGINLSSYADLVSVANLPKVAQRNWHDIPFRFWIPAFKVRPKVFLHLASNTTLSQPRKNLIPELPEAKIYPSTFPVEEAIESLKITLADFVKPRRTFMEMLHDIRIDAKKFSLIFLPFDEGHHEFIQPDFQLAINKNVLALSKNL